MIRGTHDSSCACTEFERGSERRGHDVYALRIIDAYDGSGLDPRSKGHRCGYRPGYCSF